MSVEKLTTAAWKAVPIRLAADLFIEVESFPSVEVASFAEFESTTAEALSWRSVWLVGRSLGPSIIAMLRYSPLQDIFPFVLDWFSNLVLVVVLDTYYWYRTSTLVECMAKNINVWKHAWKSSFYVKRVFKIVCASDIILLPVLFALLLIIPP